MRFLPLSIRPLFHVAVLACVGGHFPVAAMEDLETGFTDPPLSARLHSYWWWLNGNVTAEAITRDLEEMRAKGFGGALIMDAGGAEQDGNRQVPNGPVFGSGPWRDLYRHALREAARLKLELGLNIQSGWNLGGPGVTPDDAAKILCWTETKIRGPGPVSTNLPAPPARNGLLRDVMVVAVPDVDAGAGACTVTVSSAHDGYPAASMSDGKAETFWVSDGGRAEDGSMAWIRLAFDGDRDVGSLTLIGRPRYGPKTVDVRAVGVDGVVRELAASASSSGGVVKLSFDPPPTVRGLLIRVTDAHDPAPVDGRARNVQVAELRVEGPGWSWPSPAAAIRNWEVKALLRPVHGGNGDTARELAPKPDSRDAVSIRPGEGVDVSRFMGADGRFRWTAPEGAWRVFRFCYTVAPRAHVSTCSRGWEGLALDPMDAGAFQRYWDAVVEPLVLDATRIDGHTLRYLHTDSWEIEPFNWTARMPAEFRARRGYDMTPWMPVLARCVVGGVEASERFLHDFRKTVAELIAENHYGPFLANTHRHGLLLRAESGGPHGVPIDAQHCLGIIDVPMSEFWARSWRHRVTDAHRFFVKQPASAAHTYGRDIVAAEGFTTIGPHWQETVWDNLKPSFDRALCEGLNQLVWTLVDCSPRGMGMPGQVMFAGTHFNPNSTWWRQSEGFLSYINRCQWMLRQGLFVADVLYYYGDLAPNFAGLRVANPAQLPPGYDYDVATEHVLLNRVAVKDGRIVLPDGMNYGALVLPGHGTISLPVLRKLRDLCAAGAEIVGPRPSSSSGLPAWRDGDAAARQLIGDLWGRPETATGGVRYATASDWVKASQCPPDFSVREEGVSLDYIHRRTDQADIYFVASYTGQTVRATVRLRVSGRSPEWWDPVDGSVRALPEWRAAGKGCTDVPLELPPYGSGFVVFRGRRQERGERRQEAGEWSREAARNFPTSGSLMELKGPWEVQFDPHWFYPDNGTGGNMVLEQLVDWSRHEDEAVRYFSGAAVYGTTFDAPTLSTAERGPLFLSLGEVREMARVRLNGRDLGVAWCPPWRVRIPDGLLRQKGNRLEIEVVNFWPNRLIGDARLPIDRRRTKTNIAKFDDPKGDSHYTKLMPSGLMGLVCIEVETK